MANQIMMLNTEYYDMMLGDTQPLSANYVSDTIERIIADQKARLGRFLTYSQKLLDLLARSQSIQKFDNTSGTLLITRLRSLQQEQSNVEAQGYNLLTQINTIKNNPIVLAIQGSSDFYKYSSSEVNLRALNILNDLKNLLSTSTGLNNQVSTHEKNISKIESDVISKENELSGRGFIPALTKGLSAPLDMIKWVAVAGLGVMGLLVLIKTGGRK